MSFKNDVSVYIAEKIMTGGYAEPYHEIEHLVRNLKDEVYQDYLDEYIDFKVFCYKSKLIRESKGNK